MESTARRERGCGGKGKEGSWDDEKMRRWEKGRTEGWGGSEGRIGKAKLAGIKKRGKHRREGDREMGGVGEGRWGEWETRREGDGMMAGLVPRVERLRGPTVQLDKCGSEIYLYVKEGSSFRFGPFRMLFSIHSKRSLNFQVRIDL